MQRVVGVLPVPVRRTWLQLVAIVLSLLSNGVQAESRLVITLEVPVIVALDGKTLSSSVGRVSASHLPPGSHRIEVWSEAGVVLCDVRLDVPDGVEVQARWLANNELLILYPPELATNRPRTELPPPTEVDDQADPDSQVQPSSGVPIGQAHTVQVNEPGDSPHYTPHRDGLALEVIKDVTLGNGIQRRAVDSLGQAMSENRRSREVQSNSAVYVPPDRVGTVHLINRSGAPVLIYVDGTLAVELAQGQIERDVSVGIGSPRISFRDPETLELRYEGLLKVDEGIRLDLEFDEDQAPECPNYPWVWTLQSP